MMVIPWSLLVKITAARPDSLRTSMNARYPELCPHCQSPSPASLCSMPNPSPQDTPSFTLTWGVASS